jgi:hypothetical protein
MCEHSASSGLACDEIKIRPRICGGPLLASNTTTVETRHNVQSHFYEDFATVSPSAVTTNSQKSIAAQSNTSNPFSPTGQYEG